VIAERGEGFCPRDPSPRLGRKDGTMAGLPKYYEDLTPELFTFLQDQHPRGQMILDGMPRKGEDSEEEEVPPYEKWTVADLKAELKARELSTSGKQEELALRLYENDEAEESEE
jgi:hypothetical protein